MVPLFIKNFQYWNYLALNEIKQKYRRSILGTLWISLSTTISILGIGPIYSVLFNTRLSDYFLIVSIGLVSWNFISAIIGESCGVFISNSGMIKDTSLPIETYCYVVVWRNVLLLLQNLIILYLIFNIFGFRIFPNIKLVLVIIASTFFLSNLGILLSLVCTRFRDITQIVDAAMRLLFFMTPILWVVKDTKLDGSLLVKLNIFYYVVDILRDAFINNSISMNHLGIVVCLSLFFAFFKYVALNKYKNRVVYWL